MALTRINKELNDLWKNPSARFTVEQVDQSDKFNLIASIAGPAGTPYEGGIFILNLKLPNNYPFKPPKVSFSTRIYHPNVNFQGLVSLGILFENWFPDKLISNVIQEIMNLLENPNLDDPYDTEIALVYKTDYNKFVETAKLWTKKFAM